LFGRSPIVINRRVELVILMTATVLGPLGVD
jgi:hypothetical protein